MLAVAGVTAPVPEDCVAVVDDAASLPDGALARAVDLLHRRPEVGTVYIGTGEEPGQVAQPGDRWLRQAAAQGPDTLSRPCVVLRRTVFEAAGQAALDTRSDALSLRLRAAVLAGVGLVTVPGRNQAPAGPGELHVSEVSELHERVHAFRRLFDDFAPAREQLRLRSAIFRALARSARSRACVAAYDGDPVEASLCLHLARDVDGWRRRR